MSIDDLQAQLRGALDQQFATLKQQYEDALTRGREQARLDAEQQADARIASARGELEAQMAAIVAATRAEAKRDAEAMARMQTQQLEQQLQQQLEQTVQHAVNSVRRTTEMEIEALRRRVEQDVQAERERGLAALGELRQSTQQQIEQQRQSSEQALEAERQRAQSALDAALGEERQRAQGALEAALNEERRRAQTALDTAVTAAREEERRQTEAAVAGERHRVESSIGEERTRLEQALEEERERAAAELEAVKQLLEAEITAAQSEAAVVREDAGQATAAVAAARDEAAQAAAAAAAATAERDTARRAAAAVPVPEPSSAALSRVPPALRALDGAVSLSQTLEALLQHAGTIAGRAALFLINGDRLKSWKTMAIPEIDVQTVESSINGRDLLARAIQTGQATPASAELPAPPFARLAGNDAIAAPLTVNGRAVAVLYADTGTGAAASGWAEAVDLLARHASAIAALRAAMRTLDVLGGGADQASAAGNAHGNGEEGARRYARLLVSEIKLYNEAAVHIGRQQRDLRQRLRPEIDRAQRLYEERVPSAVGARQQYFHQELVQTLADGDASLLGN